MTTVLIDDSTKDGRDLIEYLRKNKSARILEETQETDWWQTISETEKKAIEEGLSDIDRKATVSYDKVKDRYAHLL